MKLPLALTFVLAAGCGGSQKPKPAAGPTCADAALRVREHIVAGAEADDHGDAAAFVAKIQPLVEQRCTTDGWSADALACMTTMPLERMPECENTLTPAQRDAFQKDMWELTQQAPQGQPR